MKRILPLLLSCFSLFGQNIDYSRIRGGPGVSVIQYGVKGDNSTDNTTALAAAAAAQKSLFFPPGIYKATTWPVLPQGASWTCDNPYTTILRPTGTHGLRTTSNTANNLIANCGILPDGTATQDGIYILNSYNVILFNLLIGRATTFGLSATGNTASQGNIVIDNTGSMNSAIINIIGVDINGGTGSGVLLKTDTGNGAAGVSLFGGHIHEHDRYGIETSGSGPGPHEIHVNGTIIEGNFTGEGKWGWCSSCTFTGMHVEHVASSIPFQLATSTTGSMIGGSFTNNIISCGSGTSAITFGNTTSRDVQLTGNIFNNCSTDAIHFDTGAKVDFNLSSNRLGTGTTKLYNYDDVSLNVQNLCIQDFTLGNGCFTTTLASPQVTFGGAINYIANESGTNNAIKGTLTVLSQLQGPGFQVFTDGMLVTVKLAHTLQAGANTFDLNPAVSAGPRSIKSSRNTANNIGTAYAVGAYVTLRWADAAGVWVDISQ